MIKRGKNITKIKIDAIKQIIMELFKKYMIESSVEIRTTPDKIWDFFYNLENNYK